MGTGPGDITIPAGTHVRIGSTSGVMEYVEGQGYVWMYEVTAQDHTESLEPGAGVMSARVTEDQLEPVPGTDVIVSGAATPTSALTNMWSGTYKLLEEVDGLAAGSLVTIGSGYVDCDVWLYQVAALDGSASAWVREDQLVDSGTPIAPTPTYPPVTASPTASITPEGGATSTGVVAYTIGDPTNVRAKPSLDAQIVAGLPPETMLQVLGKTPDGSWYRVSWGYSPNTEMWVYFSLVRVEGNESGLPQMTPAP
jgi:hypothetical protein